MDTTRKASWIVKHLIWKLVEIFEDHADDLLDELGSLDLVSLEEFFDFCLKDSQTEKTIELINLILQNGELACEKFLNHLENLVLRFPALSGLAPSFFEDKPNAFHELVEQLNVKAHLTTKLFLRDVLSIGPENINNVQPQHFEDIMWHFLRKLMDLNQTARNIELQKDLSAEEPNDDDDEDYRDIFDDSVRIHQSCPINPLDVVCVLLHCSDNFLQQEIVTKMSMCQFAVPLLLPAGDGSGCTFMLWAMRDIVKKWRPQSLVESKGFREDNVVNIEMPIFSFVRLGPNKLSKSKLLNQILNPEQYHDFFIHNNMEGGNIERKISDGLVEMSWYFPCVEKSNVFPEPIAVANLRGDLESNLEQFTFLTRISSATFIFIESMCDRQFRLLSSCRPSDTKFYFIVTPGNHKVVDSETQKHLKILMRKLQTSNKHIIMKGRNSNDAEFVKRVQVKLEGVLKSDPPTSSLENLKNHTHDLHIDVDENFPECQKARAYACNITSVINDVEQYKRKNLKLQGELWKQLSKVEKELCRMTKQGGKDTQTYQSELKQQRFSLHREQNQHDLPDSIMLFINAITHLSQIEKRYFLKWMKFELDSTAREHLSKLQEEYKKKFKESKDSAELKKIDQKLSDSSLGIEHFLRELGQFYEAECSMIKAEIIPEHRRQFKRLPGIAADLLLDGFPLELIDGDASNIPMKWITDVLTELRDKIGLKCNMRVITVLGVQSTGKSTLLNTMFGLQFPVASGRCTRGAFMTLIKVKENFQSEIGCSCLIVIDTEGLKAPELSSLDDSYEHDNELATLVIGLSDITIVNMAMENAGEMKDILQIVVHAFLRMKELGKKPNCQFVHQNVSDVSAHENNMRDRKRLLEQLDEMTKVAAKMEKKRGITRFTEVMDYDIEKHNWYIHGLWHGVPPMASVNTSYSENVHKLKQDLLDFIKSNQGPSRIDAFISWIESLWKAVKHEKFIFSFVNSLVAEAYSNLSVSFSHWEWEFRKKVNNWIISTENKVKNQSSENLGRHTLSQYMGDLQELLIAEENNMLGQLEKYYEDKLENVNLVERYREDFTQSVKFLKNELERNALSRCNEAICIQKGKFEIQRIQNKYQQVIEEKISQILDTGKKKNLKLSDQEIKQEFEAMWEETLSQLQIETLPQKNVSKAVLQQVKSDLYSRGSAVNETLVHLNNLESYANLAFSMDIKHVDQSIIYCLGTMLGISNEPYDKVRDLATSLIDMCDKYVAEKISTTEDYDDAYCQELLYMINNKLQSTTTKLPFSTQFELDIKLFIFAKASEKFQKMHETFIQKNDPKMCLEDLKPHYLSTFVSILREKDECWSRAKQFCERCLKPAITDYIFKHLGEKMVDGVLNGVDSMTFSSRSFFQCNILTSLLNEMSFEKYVQYINSYEAFSKTWILNYILEKYQVPESLERIYNDLLSSICVKVLNVLQHTTCLQSKNVLLFLENVCKKLNGELVMSKRDVKVFTFHNTAQVEQLSSKIQEFLTDMKEEILLDLTCMSLYSVLFRVTMKPEEELFRKVIGCGHQCPFCKVPCEAGGGDHKEHFASVHRPQGLGRVHWHESRHLCMDICTYSVVSSHTFRSTDTDGKWHPYKEYRTYYPDWAIQPDPSIESSDYWKYIFAQFNEEFAKKYKAKPAELPDDWRQISESQALESLQKVFNVH
ncbi:interferon-induced very large GTPase 1-like [Leptodactylus fuscus]|uniref:interferon-induced very large GTPase 1-like n=1 Tax=Leptodactylus fuscus TaxID=238119 RepID=UPI003F4EDC53